MSSYLVTWEQWTDIDQFGGEWENESKKITCYDEAVEFAEALDHANTDRDYPNRNIEVYEQLLVLRYTII